VISARTLLALCKIAEYQIEGRRNPKSVGCRRRGSSDRHPKTTSRLPFEIGTTSDESWLQKAEEASASRKPFLVLILLSRPPNEGSKFLIVPLLYL